jgi:hypothetical protein
MSDTYQTTQNNRQYYTANNKRIYVYKRDTSELSIPFKKSYRDGIIKSLPKNFPLAYNKFSKRFVDKVKIFTKKGAFRKPYQRLLDEEARQAIPELQLVTTNVEEMYGFLYTNTTFQLQGGDISMIDTVFQNLINQMNDPNAYYRVFIDYNDKFASTSLVLGNQFTVQMITDILEKIAQSAGAIENLGDLNIVLQKRSVPVGGKVNRNNTDLFLDNRKGYVPIDNDDNLCGQQCVVLGLMKYKLREKIIRGEKSINLKLKTFCNQYGLFGEMSFHDFDKIENAKVVIIDNKFEVFHITNKELTDIPSIYVYYNFVDKHYTLITNINAFSNDKHNQKKWCETCNKIILQKYYTTHKCETIKCGCCFTEYDCQEELDMHFKKPNWVNCLQCNMPCPSQECLIKHQSNMMGVKSSKFRCDGTRWRCYDCKKWFDIDHKEEHKCGEIKCTNCDIYHMKADNHRCFIQPLEMKDKSVQKDIYVYDFESKFDDNNTHIVNLVVVMKMYDNDFKLIFYDINSFGEWVLKQSNSIFIAHNGKAYDTWLLHKHYVLKTGNYPNKIILAGNKIMSMTLKSNKFIDSINHVASSLEKMPSVFGLDENKYKKGYFPYKFNTDKNQNYVGKIPDIQYYEPNKMSSKKRVDFFIWYESQKDVVYDFKNELLEYCESDVLILKNAMEVYRDSAMEFNEGIDPLDCTTIAGYCMKVFRTNHLKESKIAVLHKDEYEFCKRGFFGGRTNAINL